MTCLPRMPPRLNALDAAAIVEQLKEGDLEP
jgi:hypothetical protein